MDKKTIAERPCFLCEQNRPKEQIKKDIDGQYELLVNPFPILPQHFTIPSLKHQPQRILNSYGEIHKLLEEYPEMMVFYNGPQCGASAPDHAHFQAGTCGVLPLQMSWKRLSSNLTKIVSINDHEDISLIEDYHCTALLIRSRSQYGDEQLFRRLYDAMPEMDPEPMMNIVAWRRDEDFLSVVFPRTKHRPDCYYAEGDEQYIISPGALDMAGLIITPRQDDFDRLTPEKALSILDERTLTVDIAQTTRDTVLASVLEERKASLEHGVMQVVCRGGRTGGGRRAIGVDYQRRARDGRGLEELGVEFALAVGDQLPMDGLERVTGTIVAHAIVIERICWRTG